MKEKGPCRRLRRRWLRVNLVLTYTGLAGFALAIAIAVSGGPETAAIALVLAATALVLAAGGGGPAVSALPWLRPDHRHGELAPGQAIPLPPLRQALSLRRRPAGAGGN